MALTGQPWPRPAPEIFPLITCNLSKPETTLDQVKKSFPKLQTTDAALVATALVISGREAQAIYEGNTFNWPDDIDGLTRSLLRQLTMIQDNEAPEKKTKAAMAALDEKAVEVGVGLQANFMQAEKLLDGRDDLKTLLSDILTGQVEFQYTPQDIGWQWALDRVNWTTVSGGDLTRRVKLKATFQGDVVGLELGLTKKRTTKKAVAKVVEEEEEEVVAEAPAEVPAEVAAETEA